MLIGEGISAMIKRRYKNENWMDDKQPDTLDMPAIDALTKEIRSKYDDMFDSVSIDGKEIVMHLDNADAELHIKIKTPSNYCESYLVMHLGGMYVETKRDVQRFVDDTIRAVEDIVE
jgi:hypothetical protein